MALAGVTSPVALNAEPVRHCLPSFDDHNQRVYDHQVTRLLRATITRPNLHTAKV